MHDQESGKCLLQDCWGESVFSLSITSHTVLKSQLCTMKKAVLSFHIARESRVHARHSYRTGEWFKVYLTLHDRTAKTFSWCWPIDLGIKKKFFLSHSIFRYGGEGGKFVEMNLANMQSIV